MYLNYSYVQLCTPWQKKLVKHGLYWKCRYLAQPLSAEVACLNAQYAKDSVSVVYSNTRPTVLGNQSVSVGE